ncbi:uncharacterized protein TNCV_599731 [Trichonephila clavipes]|nr:uncharacterized protein TNCV_599731 [Trichonephila clavipes]
MSKYLSLKDFVWSDNNLTEQDILNVSDESDVGYILEVDLEYPSDLHFKHSDFPLAPENKPPPNCKETRLLTTLEPKTKYVLHYSNLKLYLKLELVLKKIQCVLKFFQSPWLKDVAAVAEWYRYRIVACLVTSSIPVPLKTRRVGQRCTLNLSRAETSSRWCGVVVRRGGASSGVVHVT